MPLPSFTGAEDLEFTPYEDRSPPDMVMSESADMADQFGSVLDNSEAVLASIDESGETLKGEESAKDKSA